jgi:hypothetical protein
MQTLMEDIMIFIQICKDKKLQQQISKCNKHKATTPYMANQMKCVAQIRTRQTIFPNKKGK